MMSTFDTTRLLIDWLCGLWLAILVCQVVMAALWMRLRTQMRHLDELYRGWESPPDAGANSGLMLSRTAQLVSASLRLPQAKSTADRAILLLEIRQFVDMIERDQSNAVVGAD